MLSIRFATAADAALILEFIRRLAEYERAPLGVTATAEDLLRDGFGPEPRFRCLIAEWDNRPAGFAFFYPIYSTARGRPGLYLEDLYVVSDLRSKGIGKALLRRLAQIAIDENCFSVGWMVLKWNQLALRFYESLGAETLGAWETMRVTGEALEQLARGGEARDGDPLPEETKAGGVDP